ncbi:hypothetical protein [Arenimonas sp. MALMAid1274]|uniref:hypothetical protein n=1 Tax=Arenimonas sp. MALMAid1274 TaxID=3411630 RepID=UPI003BA302EA
MTPTDRSTSPLAWALPVFALAVGVLGMTALWLAVTLSLRSPCGWLAPVAALDMVLMLRLAAAPAHPLRAVLAVAGTALAIGASYFMFAATQMGRLLGLTPLESADRIGWVLAGDLVRYATDAYDVAYAVLALVLAAWLARPAAGRVSARRPPT